MPRAAKKIDSGRVQSTKTDGGQSRSRGHLPVAHSICDLLLLRSDRNPQQAYVELDDQDAQIIVTLGAGGCADVRLVRSIGDDALIQLEPAPQAKIDIKLAAERRALDEHHREVIQTYATGQWLRKPNMDQAGLVPVASRDGVPCGYVDILPKAWANGIRFQKYTPGREHPVRIGVRAEDVHVGWWWSRVMPVPPNAPSWHPGG